MKKHLFILAAGFMMLTACTSEEVVDVSRTQSNVIGFENVVNKPTKAIDGDLTTAQFDNFLVYGYYTKDGMATPIQIFNGVPVSKVRNTTTGEYEWQYDGVRYWIPKCTYHFYAYSCADVALSAGKGTPAMTLTNETSLDGRALSIMGYLCDGSHQHDLVYAEKESVVAKEQNNPQVGLDFKHGLCKVKAAFTTDFPTGYEVKITNVKISGFYNYADFNVGSGDWSNFTKSDNAQPILLNIEEGKNVITNASTTAADTSEAFLIPKKYASNVETAMLHFTIEVSKDGNIILQRNITGTWSPQWEKSNMYKYNVNITGSSAGIEPIVFAATQNLDGTWNTSTEVSMVFGVDAASPAGE